MSRVPADTYMNSTLYDPAHGWAPGRSETRKPRGCMGRQDLNCLAGTSSMASELNAAS